MTDYPTVTLTSGAYVRGDDGEFMVVPAGSLVIDGTDVGSEPGVERREVCGGDRMTVELALRRLMQYPPDATVRGRLVVEWAWPTDNRH